MRERFGARDPRSWQLRFHSQTAGVSLTAQQPRNNVVRTALQAMAAVLGGTQSLHTNALDEALALPTADAALLALRTQQVIAHETGVTGLVDPFGGSYFVERLTSDLEAEALAAFERIDRMGGMVAAIVRGYPQREIAESAYAFQRAVEAREQVIVGANRFAAAGERPIQTLYIDESAGATQLARLEALRRRRDAGRVERALAALQDGAAGTANTMPLIIDAVRAHATVGEMCGALRAVWGEYVEQASI
jgi:methylmalonyl-CoA mutase N-terminal domain/subunit